MLRLSGAQVQGQVQTKLTHDNQIQSKILQIPKYNSFN